MREGRVRRSAIILTLFLVTAILAGLEAIAQPLPARLALVVTNQDYRGEPGPLTNTHSDGDRVGSALERVGFKVWRIKDATSTQISEAVGAHAVRLRQAGPNAAGFFYYSGHGASDGAVNYVIPLGKPISRAADLRESGVALDAVIATIAAAKAGPQFVVFDACRNQLDKSVDSLKGFRPQAQVAGMLIAFATADGQTAKDNGAYSAAVLAELSSTEEAIRVFQKIGRRVQVANGQLPLLQDNRTADFYFNTSRNEPVVRGPVDPGPEPELFASLSAAQRRDLRKLFELAEVHAGGQQPGFVNKITFGIGQDYRRDGSFLVPRGEPVPQRSALELTSRVAVAREYDNSVSTIIRRYPTPRGNTASLVSDYFAQLKRKVSP